MVSDVHLSEGRVFSTAAGNVYRTLEKVTALGPHDWANADKDGNKGHHAEHSRAWLPAVCCGDTGGRSGAARRPSRSPGKVSPPSAGSPWGRDGTVCNAYSEHIPDLPSPTKYLLVPKYDQT